MSWLDLTNGMDFTKVSFVVDTNGTIILFNVLQLYYQ